MNHDDLVAAFTDLQKRFNDLEKQKGVKINVDPVAVYKRKLVEFKGTSTENIDDWTVKAKEAIKAQGFKDKKQAAEFLCTHLSGDALIELKYATQAEKEDPELLLELLKDTYGDSRSAIELLDMFNSRKQRDKESINDYAHSLMRYLDRAHTKEPAYVPDREKTLKNRFAENIKDQNLRRDVKKANRDHPNWTFRELRAEANTLADDCKESRKSVRQELLEVNDEACALSSSQNFSSNSQKVNPDMDEMNELKERMSQLFDLQKSQQEQIGLQYKTIRDLQKQLNSKTFDTDNVTRDKNSGNKQLKGPCYFCNQYGHLQRDCWLYKRENKKKTLSGTPRTNPPRIATAQYTVPMDNMYPMYPPYYMQPQPQVFQPQVRPGMTAMEQPVQEVQTATPSYTVNPTNAEHTRP